VAESYPQTLSAGVVAAAGVAIVEIMTPRELSGARGEMTSQAKRRRVVEVAAALGLPLPTGAALVVAALAGALDLGGGPLEAGPDLVGLQLGDRPLVAVGGLPAALAEPAGDDDPVALAECW
jgi:hypothetical protein